MNKSIYADPNAHYGTGCWEGIRCNDGNIFRLDDHVNRLIASAKITHTPLPLDWCRENSVGLITIIKNFFRESFSQPINKIYKCLNEKEIQEKIKEGIILAAKDHAKKTGENGFYIRPSIFLKYGEMSLDQSANTSTFRVVTWPWGDYHKENVINSGIDVIVSQYSKECGHPEFMKAKTPPNYGLSVMEKIDAKKKGYLDALFLNRDGSVAEATGANIFVVQNRKIYTPASDIPEILNGVTRDSVIQLLRSHEYDVTETTFRTNFMYEAEEVFLTGTASRVVPVVSITDVDGCKHVIGDGKPGTLTKKAYERYMSAIHGEIPSFRHWLTKVE
ncbi:MAG TPA: aminotransferase class IV [Candidatus Nanoarchaeia archaeon]|nr:aminotransferase class IV [Candidatus Nanoarchaeia archaeon]